MLLLLGPFAILFSILFLLQPQTLLFYIPLPLLYEKEMSIPLYEWAALHYGAARVASRGGNGGKTRFGVTTLVSSLVSRNNSCGCVGLLASTESAALSGRALRSRRVGETGEKTRLGETTLVSRNNLCGCVGLLASTEERFARVVLRAQHSGAQATLGA